MNSTTAQILMSTTTVLLSKKLFKEYQQGVDITVQGFKINSILKLVTINEFAVLDDDMLVCFDKDLNAVGIIEVGILGYAMVIKDSGAAFINLYRPMPITKPDLESGYVPRVKYETPAVVAYKPL